MKEEKEKLGGEEEFVPEEKEWEEIKCKDFVSIL